MADKNAVIRGLIGGIIYDLMIKSNIYNIFVDENTSLADKLNEIVNSLNRKLTTSDIVNDLVTGGADAPLSAEMGVKLKGLIDGATFDETDPTVPEWAKQAEKPDYTAEEIRLTEDDATVLAEKLQEIVTALNGKVTSEQVSETLRYYLQRNEVPRVLDEALAEAKEDGQFDGLSIFYGGDVVGYIIGKLYGIEYKHLQTNGHIVKTGDLICLENGYLYIVRHAYDYYCNAECVLKLKGADGKPGLPGRDGVDGVDGVNGFDGVNGRDGVDGFSPIATVARVRDGAQITITDANGTTTATVTDGRDGADGAAGKDGKDGKDGEDGFSPIVTPIRMDNGVKISVYDVNGFSGEMVYDGQPGADGVSPVAKVEQTASGAKITIIDADGVTTAIVTNGKDGTSGSDGSAGAVGPPGPAGEDGKDGFSPTVTTTREEDGVVIMVTDRNGTRGAKVYDGTDGTDGKDGISPTARVYQEPNGVTIHIEDANGMTSATVTNGEKGDRGDPGTLEMRGAKAGQFVAVSSADNLGIPLTFEGVDQTHFTERVQILAETNFDGDGYAHYPNHLHLIKGQEYAVLWNGVEYFCTAVEVGGEMGLGNLGAAGVPGFAQTDAPFVITEMIDEIPVTVYPLDGSTEFTVSIYRNVIHKLDNKYLNLDWIPAKAGTVILPAQIARATNGITSVGPIDAKYRVEGTKINVLIDGIPHETEIHVDGNEIYANTEFGFNNRVMIMFADTHTFLTGYGMDGRTVEICLPDFTYSKIPVEYLPDDYNPGGSGGTSAPSDWNADEGEAGHVLNRTHYKAIGDIFLEQTITFDEGGLFSTACDKEFVAGNTYAVMWGGAKYECTAVTGYSPEGIAFLAIGNISLLSGAGDTGEPFVAQTTDGMIAIMALDGSSSQTVSICENEYHPLDRRYLPQMYHVVKLPEDIDFASDNPTYKKVYMTDTDGKILEALLNHIPVYVEFPDGDDTLKAVVRSYFITGGESRAKAFLAMGHHKMVNFYMYAHYDFGSEFTLELAFMPSYDV